MDGVSIMERDAVAGDAEDGAVAGLREERTDPVLVLRPNVEDPQHRTGTPKGSQTAPRLHSE